MEEQKKRKDEVRDYYMKFTRDNEVSVRIETARLLLEARGDVRCNNWSNWCRLIHMPVSQYGEVVENSKPVPMSVWPALYELGFDLNWFASGLSSPFRSQEFTAPVNVTVGKKERIKQLAMQQLNSTTIQ